MRRVVSGERPSAPPAATGTAGGGCPVDPFYFGEESEKGDGAERKLQVGRVAASRRRQRQVCSSVLARGRGKAGKAGKVRKRARESRGRGGQLVWSGGGR